MDMPSGKKLFEVFCFVVVFAVPVILYLMEKAGASLIIIFIVGWLSIAAAALYLVLNIPWVWADGSMAVRAWRVSLVSAAALLVVEYGAIKIWPTATSPTEATKLISPHESPAPKSPRFHTDSADPFSEFDDPHLAEWGHELAQQIAKDFQDYWKGTYSSPVGLGERTPDALLLAGKFSKCCHDRAIAFQKEAVARLGADPDSNGGVLVDSLKRMEQMGSLSPRVIERVGVHIDTLATAISQRKD
jgi:hypothetical protein